MLNIFFKRQCKINQKWNELIEFSRPLGIRVSQTQNEFFLFLSNFPDKNELSVRIDNASLKHA